MEHVTRQEFERLCSYADKLMAAVQEQNRIVGEHLNTTSNLISRITTAERVLDGVKDAVLFVADNTADIVAFDGETIRVHSAACDIIAKAQQPPATATGEPVVIDPAAKMTAFHAS